MRWQAIGPGLLFAGAAVGVSHLVQATRAGAGFGLGLVVTVILAHVVKYPGFVFGPRYAAQTGNSLLEGYRKQGLWALGLFALVTVALMFAAQAAVTFLSAGLVAAVLRIEVSPVVISIGLLALCALVLAVGRFRWLDRIMKVVVAAMTVLTVAATILILPDIDWSSFTAFPSGIAGNVAAIGFVAALIGWMPSAIDIAVWHSLWTLARRRDTGYKPSIREVVFDFNVGYFGTAVLAICFVLLGAGLFHSSAHAIPPGTSAGAFAAMVIDLYAETLGEWARPVIGATAIGVMFSTTLTVTDGFARTGAGLVTRFKAAEVQGGDADTDRSALYWGFLVLVTGGAAMVLLAIRTRLLLLVDIATTVSFITAPVLAFLNHRAVIAAPGGPGRAMRWYSVIGIVVLSAFSLYFLYLRFGAG